MASTQVAFVPSTQVARARSAEGVLSGLTFAAKDVFAVRGHRATAGHPDWARSHPPAERDAPVVDALLHAGADLVGVTILDELAYSLAGTNPHYGTPANPRAPGRLCGGSSCGSAAAVAAFLCDFALGTDTAGSIRVPASFCGLFGFRPSHARISTEGVVPLAPSFDTVGFLAHAPSTFESVARLLLGSEPARPIQRALIADDALALCDAGVSELLEDLAAHALKSLHVPVERVKIAAEGFAPLSAAFRRLQAREVWRVHGEWVRELAPQFGPGVKERFAQARELYEVADAGERVEEDEAVCRAHSARMDALLTPGTLLFVPPTPGIAPRHDASGPELEISRAHTLELTCVASLSGLPQLVVPARELSGAPVGLSFLAARGADAWLAQLAPVLDQALRA